MKHIVSLGDSIFDNKAYVDGGLDVIEQVRRQIPAGCIVGEFEYHYREMLQGVLSLKKPTAVCTIYYPRIPDPFTQKMTVAALATYNDAIIRLAFLSGVPLIDLRLVCDENSDYANEIEPSEKGGGKIANAIVRLVSEHNFESRRTEVFI
jgi:hypothetical protein